MIRNFFCALLCLCYTSAIFAQDTPPTQDTITLQRVDTTFTFTHAIAPGQTLYSLSKTYQVTLEGIHAVNPDLMETELSIGDTLIMPLNLELLRQKPPRKIEHSAIAVYHVQHGETLFAIARRWLNVDTDYIKKLNKLDGASLSLNLPLTLGWIDTRFQKAKKPSPEEKKIAAADNELIQATKETIEGSAPVVEQGKAIWKTSKSSGDKPYILHRKAKINSLVQLYNPMTGKKIHAKVVGRIPERNYDDNVMVVLTPYLANALKARDKSFFLKMKYTM